MAEHAITEMVAVEQCAEFYNIVSQRFRRHTGIFSKRQRLGLPFCIAEQAYGFFTHIINALNTRQIGTYLITDDATFTVADQAIQAFTQRFQLAFNQFAIISSKLNDIQTLHILARNISNVFTQGSQAVIFPARFSTFESTVSTDNAFASTIN